MGVIPYVSPRQNRAPTPPQGTQSSSSGFQQRSWVPGNPVADNSTYWGDGDYGTSRGYKDKYCSYDKRNRANVIISAFQNMNLDVKISVPEFDGKTDAHGFIDWLNQVDRVLAFKKCGDPRAVTLMETKLTGYALNWWEGVQQLRVASGGDYITNWGTMRHESMTRFIPGNYEEEIFAKLQNFFQTLTQMVDEYASNFYLFSSRVLLSKSEAKRISRLKLRLTKRLHDELVLFNGQSLLEVVEMAKRMEIKFRQSSYSSYTPLAPATTTTSTTTKTTRPTRVTSATICCNCGKTGHMKCECTTPRKHIALLTQNLLDHINEAFSHMWGDDVDEETLFPNLDKVVFLDDDVVVQHDLTPLWDIDLEGKVNGAVETCRGEDEWVMSKRFKSYFNFSHPLIANSLNPDECAWAYGMNIFNLNAWRKTNIRDTYHSWLKQNLQSNLTMWKLGTLPPALIAFRGNVHPIDPHWHMLGLGYQQKTDVEHAKKAAVIHYNGQSKPWLEIGFEHLRPLWTKYVNYSNDFIKNCHILE
ncbi:hypothetical protein GIB67_007242 [Kingdonia uniflora]|uniref:Hexosyltransferase n=1 Tax=Kingdonia uniflora TaxID=39325 RepID=A0A7J7NWZ6_9MAGN|nr:hypothetical protein GIB67_007242 [Kingdonia uniflora]